jgi:hypothetical protein
VQATDTAHGGCSWVTPKLQVSSAIEFEIEISGLILSGILGSARKCLTLAKLTVLSVGRVF